MDEKNKQLKSLVNWVKNNADAESELITKIEGNEIIIKTEIVFSQIHLIIIVNGTRLKYYYAYNFGCDGKKWEKINM